MRAKILTFLKGEVHPGESLCCAVSGGADSVALLHCLHAMQAELGVTVTACHFNHGLRGEESDRDEAFVREFCQTHGIPLAVGHGDTPARVASSDDSVEEAARRLRYEFFETVPTRVVTAHTADDNLETLLINLLRGTSLAGLGGIPPLRGKFLRPMLTVSREEVLCYLQEFDLPHVEDSSNTSDVHLRNRLRQQVVPLLKEENPALLLSVSAMTERLRQDESYLMAQAREALTAAKQGEGYRCSYLKSQPDPILHRAAILLLQGIPDRTARHVDALCALIRSTAPSARLDLPGGKTARREYDLLLFSPAVYAPIPHTVLLIPGSVRVGSWQIDCQLSENRTKNLCIPYDPGESYYVRARQSGDRLSLPGGGKSLKNLMIDRKIPAQKRASIPVLCDSTGPIALLGVAADCRKTQDTAELYLSISHWEATE